ncbi:MAG: hypothetical protein RLZZ395_510 [Pseudomonadota bacterium]
MDQLCDSAHSVPSVSGECLASVGLASDKLVFLQPIRTNEVPVAPVCFVVRSQFAIL